jgi:sugar phosphate isomerase/epimerase
MVTFKGHEIPVCFATVSIGYGEKQTLPEKLKAIAGAGFTAIELGMPDIVAYGKRVSGKEPDVEDFGTLAGVAKQLGELCKAHGLEILMLQPFANFEGWPKGSNERKDAFERAQGWMEVMEACGTDMLQASYFLPPSILIETNGPSR